MVATPEAVRRGFVALDALVERQQPTFGKVAFISTLATGLGMYQFDEGLVIHGLTATQGLEYVQDDLFHSAIVKARRLRSARQAQSEAMRADAAIRPRRLTVLCILHVKAPART